MDGGCLTLENLSKDFGDKRVLNEVFLKLEPGEILGLIGPNGSGKTTLIKLIVGLLFPTEGSVKIFGRERGELTRRELIAIGYVPEEGETA